MTPKKQWALIALAIAAALIAARSCDSNPPDQGNADNLAPEVRAQIEANARAAAAEAEPTAADAKAQATEVAGERVAAIKAKIASYAIEDMTPDEYPDIYKSLGKKGVADAKRGAQAAAYRVAQSAACDSVETASITMQSTKRNQQYFVNCANAKQWNFKPSELKDKAGKWYTAENAPAADISDTERRAAERARLETEAPGNVIDCENRLKARLKHPDSADFHTLMGASNFINNNDERAIQIEFEAKNGFNAELTYTGQCVYKKNGKVAVDIFDR